MMTIETINVAKTAMIVGSVWRVPKATMMPTKMEAMVDRPR